MFQQIVSQLSMTPQAASQLTFYARRLKQESITRFFSAFAAVLLVALQVLTVVSPASAANSANDNDLIPGGYSTKGDFLSTYDNSTNLQAIYTHFGVTRADIASSGTVMTTINSRQNGNTLKSVGHNPTSCAGEDKITVGPGYAGTIYLRSLSCFDTGSNRTTGSTYQALVGKRASDGGFFAIIKACGNIVVQTIPPPPPTPSYACTRLTGSPLSGPAPLDIAFTATASTAGGAEISGYRFYYGDGVVQDDPVHTLSAKSGHRYLKAGTYLAKVEVTDTKTHVLKGNAMCSLSIAVGVPPTTTPVPHTPVPTPQPTSTPLPSVTPLATATPTPTCKPGVPVGSQECSNLALTCDSLTGTPASGTAPLQVAFTAKGTATEQTITDYQFNFGDHSTSDSKTSSVTHVYSASGSYLATVTVKGSSGATSTGPSCQFTVNVGDVPAAFMQTKSAFNQTQNIDATQKTANGGDIIVYSLTTKNTGGATGTVETTDNIADILEYADITDLGGGKVSEKIISWSNDSVGAGKSVTHTFTATVKNPVPLTATGISNPRSFDLKMENVFGNPVVVDIAPPPSKQMEVASQTMPQTGAGTNIMIMLVVGGFIFFFYLRNRQLVAEIKLLRNEYQGDASHVG